MDRDVEQQITIDLGPNGLVQRVDKNINQHIIVVTADKAKLCLLEARDRTIAANSWQTPAGLLITFVVVFTTATFHDVLTLTKEFWRALFVLLTLASAAWLAHALVKLRQAMSIDEILELLRTGAAPLPTASVTHVAPPIETEPQLEILEATYGFEDRQKEVAEFLRKAIIGNKLHLYVGNEPWGDPAHGETKTLRIKYRFKGEVHDVSLQEGSDLDLPSS